MHAYIHTYIHTLYLACWVECTVTEVMSALARQPRGPLLSPTDLVIRRELLLKRGKKASGPIVPSLRKEWKWDFLRTRLRKCHSHHLPVLILKQDSARIAFCAAVTSVSCSSAFEDPLSPSNCWRNIAASYSRHKNAFRIFPPKIGLWKSMSSWFVKRGQS